MQLQAKRIAFLLDEGFEDLEFWVTVMRLREEGAQVTIMSHDGSKEYHGKNALIAALPAMNDRDRCVTAARILARWSPPKNFDVLTWNLDRSLAWRAVSTNWSYLQSAACPPRQMD